MTSHSAKTPSSYTGGAKSPSSYTGGAKSATWRPPTGQSFPPIPRGTVCKCGGAVYRKDSGQIACRSCRRLIPGRIPSAGARPQFVSYRCPRSSCSGILARTSSMTWTCKRCDKSAAPPPDGWLEDADGAGSPLRRPLIIG